MQPEIDPPVRPHTIAGSPLRFLLSTFALLAVIAFEYGESFDFYFVGDDFAFIEFVLNEKLGILRESSCFYHYYPLGLLLNALPATVGLMEPKWFVGLNFSLFLLCATLVMYLYYSVSRNLFTGFLAALLYSTAIPNSEVIYWKTGAQTIAMAAFSLVSLLLFAHYLRERSRAAFVGCILAFTLSMLCIEQGAVTFGILLLYDLLFHSVPNFRMSESKKEIALGFLIRQSILLAVPATLTAVKVMLGLELSPFPLTSRPWWMIEKVAVETMARLFDFNNLLHPFITTHSALRLMVILGTCIFFLYILVRKSKTGLFFFLASLGPILIISIGAGGPNLRYFCLPLAFFTCFLCGFISDFSNVLVHTLRRIFGSGGGALNGGTGGRSAWARKILCAGVCFALAGAGLSGNLKRRDYWKAASTIQENIVQTAEHAFLTGAISANSNRKLYLLNIPAEFRTRTGAVFYVASNSLMPDLRHRLGAAAERIEPVASGNPFEMSLNGETVIYRVLGRNRILTETEIKMVLDQGHSILRFSPQRKDLVPFAVHQERSPRTTTEPQRNDDDK